MGAGSQGQLESESSQRRFRAAARTQAAGHAGAEHRPVLARLARRQPADLRRSRQHALQVRGCAVTWRSPSAMKKTSRAKSGSTSSRWRRPLRWPSVRPGTMPASRLVAGLVKGWRGKVAFQALRGVLPGGSELQPVSGVVKSDGQSLTFDAIKGKIGGGEATASIDAKQGAEWHRVECAAFSSRRRRHRRCAIAISRCPAGRASMQMALTSQGRSASALTGALSGSGTVTLESARDRRTRSARVRGGGPRQRQRSGQGRCEAEADRRARAAGRRACGRSAQIPFNDQGRPASRRRHHAGCQWCAGHRLRRIRYSRRPGRHPRRARTDDGWSGGRPSRNSIVCCRHARRTQSQRRRRARCRPGWR